MGGVEVRPKVVVLHDEVDYPSYRMNQFDKEEEEAVVEEDKLS